MILDEAQFIKNPAAQVTQSVKQLEGRSSPRPHRHPAGKPPARPLEHRRFRPARLPRHPGTVHRNLRAARGENAESAQRIARRQLSAKLRPLHAAPPQETGRQGSARPHRGTPRLRARRRPAQALPGRAAPQPRAGHADRRRKRASPRARCTCSPPSPACARSAAIPSSSATTPPPARPRPCSSCSNRSLAEGQKVLVFSQFVQMLAAPRGGMPPAPDPHPHSHRRDQGPAGSGARLPGRPQRLRCSCSACAPPAPA